MPAFQVFVFRLILRQWLSRAVVFQLPDNGQLFESRDYRPEVMDLVRLPYPLMAIEFQADDTLYAPESGLARADKRIAVAFSPAALPAAEREYLCLLTETTAWLEAGPDVLGLIALYAPREPEHPLTAWGFAPGLLPCSRGKPRPSPVGVAREGQGRGGCQSGTLSETAPCRATRLSLIRLSGRGRAAFQGIASQWASTRYGHVKLNWGLALKMSGTAL